MSIKVDGALNALVDANGNEYVKYAVVAAAVNEATLSPAATAGRPSIAVTGGDTNISGELLPKGTGGWAIGAGGAPIAKSLKGETTWDPGSIADGDDLSTTVTVTGAAVGDPCFASLSTLGANDVLISAHVQAADTVRVVLLNRTGGAFDAASGTLRVVCFKMV